MALDRGIHHLVQLREHWAAYEWRPASISGGLGVLLLHHGHLSAAVTFGYDGSGRASDIFIMRNPDKLARLRDAAVALS